jgi:hypothetical protein
MQIQSPNGVPLLECASAFVIPPLFSFLFQSALIAAPPCAWQQDTALTPLDL